MNEFANILGGQMRGYSEVYNETELSKVKDARFSVICREKHKRININWRVTMQEPEKK